MYKFFDLMDRFLSVPEIKDAFYVIAVFVILVLHDLGRTFPQGLAPLLIVYDTREHDLLTVHQRRSQHKLAVFVVLIHAVISVIFLKVETLRRLSSAAVRELFKCVC